MIENKYLFIHIPKTAGRSIVTALGLKVNNQHKAIADYCRDLGEDVVRGLRKFTVIRNPWDRVVSWYYFFGAMGPHKDHLPFDEWLRKKFDVFRRQIKFPGCRVPLCQFSFLKTTQGEVLMDTFLQYEKLAEQWPAHARTLGASESLRHIGAEERFDHARMLGKKSRLSPVAADYRELYTATDLVEIVAELDREAVECFGYKFGDAPLIVPRDNHREVIRKK